MKKKKYISPTTTTIVIQKTVLLAGSANADWNGAMGAPLIDDDPEPFSDLGIFLQ